jgi:hypothetical protein
MTDKSAANTNRTPVVFLFYIGKYQGWVFVPWETMHRLNYDTKNLSWWSRADAGGAYLEELIDYPAFEAAFLAKTNERVVFFDIHGEEEDVRMKACGRGFAKPPRLTLVS